MKKCLILRLSSFGDIAQCLPAAQAIREHFPEAAIHWVVRSDLADLPSMIGPIDKVWSLDRKTGFRGLIFLCKQLSNENFTHLYDAHNNLRSWIIRLYLRANNFRLKIVIRSKFRMKRFLLFKLRINTFPKPFLGSTSFLSPVEKWIDQSKISNISRQRKPFSIKPNPNGKNTEIDGKKIESTLSVAPSSFDFSNAILLAPEAAWTMKTWPESNWKQLVSSMPSHNFLILGGNRSGVTQAIHECSPKNTINLGGRLSWKETINLVLKSKLIVSADTGVMHLADVLGVPTIALIGPTAFGYPSAKTSQIMEVPLNCRPCTKDGRGKCSNSIYQRCMVEIDPHQVSKQILNFFGTNLEADKT